ncbi:MAG: hypothetical protein WCC92_09000 [Candidatus Korobacteraceae bacterium]
MKKTSASQTSFGSPYSFRTLRAFVVMLIYLGCLVAPSLSHGAELKQNTLAYWNAYLDAALPEMTSQTPFLWVDQKPERLQHVRDGEILVSSAGKENPKPVASGLIHDWVGAAFLPNASIQDVLSAARDYSNYKEYYKPTVVDSRLLGSDGSCEKYSMRVVNKEVVAQTALDMEYETCYFKIDDRRWYSTTHTTRVQEIRHLGRPDEQELPPDHGSGYIWRLYSVARFEQRDGGTYVEVEAIALSRDIPIALRWMVNPIVRRVSRNSMVVSLQQMKEAVRLTEDAERTANLPTTAHNGSRGAFVSEVGIAKSFAPSGKP